MWWCDLLHECNQTTILCYMLESFSCQKNANRERVYIVYYEVGSFSIRPNKYWQNKNDFTWHNIYSINATRTFLGIACKQKFNISFKKLLAFPVVLLLPGLVSTKSKRLHFEQTCSFQLEVWLSMSDLSVDTRH